MIGAAASTLDRQGRLIIATFSCPLASVGSRTTSKLTVLVPTANKGNAQPKNGHQRVVGVKRDGAGSILIHSTHSPITYGGLRSFDKDPRQGALVTAVFPLEDGQTHAC